MIGMPRSLLKLVLCGMGVLLVGLLSVAVANGTASAGRLSVPVAMAYLQDSTTTYVVQRGDTLFSIARRFGTTVPELVQLNGIQNPNLIRVGQRLIVPVPTTVTPTPTPSAPLSPWMPPATAIEVFSPVANGVYHSPMEVIGFSQTFEGQVNLRLSNEAGEVLAERPTLGGSVDGFDFFHTYLRFTTTEEQEGFLEVFEISAEDGSEINKVTVPLLLLPGQRVVDVNNPAVGVAVCSPVLIAGYSNTFEANVVVRLGQRDSTTILEDNTWGGTLGVYQDFSTTLAHSAATPQAILISAYELNGRGIGEIDHTRVPVTLYPPGTQQCP
jgi:murein DD-endopeptidase MepM/ murein hydrolase activator NlpD